ncbi:MAG: tRNA 4-thiouridine(8) synthase ThiI [bacterium]
MTKTRARCVALMSGGLDSALAVRVIQDQGIEVTGVNFAGGYCLPPHGGPGPAEVVSERLGIELARLPIDEGFIELVKAPRYGHGRNLNPCIDCHILMVRRSWEWGRARGAAFVITGEVLGQRPMSQRKQGLELVAKRSGAEGYLLRPLSARLLEPTVPEQKGIVDRARLLDIQGRSRKRQFELAAGLGLSGYANPAGGCLLTDAGFAARLGEALAHGEDSVATVELLRFGRHFRLPSGARLVVGRNEAENDELVRRRPEGAAVIDAGDLPGPVGLLIPDRAGDRELAARICARYSDRRQDEAVPVLAAGAALSVRPASPAEAAGLIIN